MNGDNGSNGGDPGSGAAVKVKKPGQVSKDEVRQINWEQGAVSWLSTHDLSDLPAVSSVGPGLLAEMISRRLTAHPLRFITCHGVNRALRACYQSPSVNPTLERAVVPSGLACVWASERHKCRLLLCVALSLRHGPHICWCLQFLDAWHRTALDACHRCVHTTFEWLAHHRHGGPAQSLATCAHHSQSQYCLHDVRPRVQYSCPLADNCTQS